MIRAAIICPDSDLRERLEKSLSEVRGLYVTRRFNYFPDELELKRAFQAGAPEMLFLSMEAPEQALELASRAAALVEKIEIVAVTRQQNEQMLLSMMKAGVRHVLSAPFEEERVAETVYEAAGRIDAQRGLSRGGSLYSFLPAKPGCGASTLALNVGLALSRDSERLALLMDFDFNLGVIGLLLGLPAGQTVFDAAADTLDSGGAAWSRRIASLDALHVLPSGVLNPGMRIELTQLRHLIEFARRVYSDICVDMSGNLESFSVETLRESERIILVTALDPISAAVAGKKMNLLTRLDLADRVLAVATRTPERDWLPVEQLERQIGRKVDVVVPHDRAAVRAAVDAREPVDPRSRLGKHCVEIARLLTNTPHLRPMAALKRVFLEHFSLSPSR